MIAVGLIVQIIVMETWRWIIWPLASTAVTAGAAWFTGKTAGWLIWAWKDETDPHLGLKVVR